MHLLRGATQKREWIIIRIINFNSRTSCEVRLGLVWGINNSTDFNSRTSCEVRHIGADAEEGLTWISTHAPLARCDAVGVDAGSIGHISTHAPLARCDTSRPSTVSPICTISTHAPLARCDQVAKAQPAQCANFNSRTSCEVRHLQSSFLI